MFDRSIWEQRSLPIWPNLVSTKLPWLATGPYFVGTELTAYTELMEAWFVHLDPMLLTLN